MHDFEIIGAAAAVIPALAWQNLEQASGHPQYTECEDWVDVTQALQARAGRCQATDSAQSAVTSDRFDGTLRGQEPISEQSSGVLSHPKADCTKSDAVVSHLRAELLAAQAAKGLFRLRVRQAARPGRRGESSLCRRSGCAANECFFSSASVCRSSVRSSGLRCASSCHETLCSMSCGVKAMKASAQKGTVEPEKLKRRVEFQARVLCG